MANPAEVKPARHLYFVNPLIDYAVIGGASVLLFTIFFLKGYTGRTQEVYLTAAWLMWIVNWPHFSATNYRLYHSKSNILQYPVTAIAIPMLMVAGVASSLASPEGIAPFFVKFFLLWSPYHFSGQSLGISMIYARRAGFHVGKFERYALSGFIFGAFLFSSARAETRVQDWMYYGVRVPSIGLPLWVADAARIGMFACGAALAVVVIRWCIVNRRILPPIVLLPALTHYLWFVPGPLTPSFNEFVPFFHSLQYLLIAWSMQLKEKMDERGIEPSGGYVTTESARWGVLNFIGGVILFWGIPRLAERMGVQAGLAEPVIISAVQIHHFFVDGVIWKLKNPKVGSPLLVNIEEMLRPQMARAPA